MPQLSHRVQLFTDSVIRRMTRICNKYEAINLSQGFPDFPPPRELTDRLGQVSIAGPHQYAVTFGAPVLLAFNAVNNLFGVGCSSMMSRALGAKRYDTVRGSASFGLYCSILCGLLFSLLYFTHPAALLPSLPKSEVSAP